MRVFLGGTCNGSLWRNYMMEKFDEMGIDYFNPVVEDWTEECMENELRERKECDVVLYCITPKMTGVYSIAEAVDDSNKQPRKTILVMLRGDEDKEFDEGQMRSLQSVAKLVISNGARAFYSLHKTALYLKVLK